jgi:SAM-dependent methyltransferase
MSEHRTPDHQRAAAYFDRSGELFDSLYSMDSVSPWKRFLNRHFRSDIYERYRLTVEHLKRVEASSVLDVGVGGARYAKGYVDAGIKHVVGVDISSTMLEFARAHVSQIAEHERIFQFVLADVDAFDTTEKFDVVVAMGFFDYTPDPLRCLLKLQQFCNDSVIASFPSRSLYRTPIRKLRYIFKNCPVFFYDRFRIMQISTQAGFAGCEVTKIKGSGMDYVAVFRKR